jgi:hypothetical protein
MSFTEVLEELPALTFEQRQMVIRKALEVDETPLSPREQSIVDERLEKLRKDPESAVSMDDMNARLRRRFK